MDTEGQTRNSAAEGYKPIRQARRYRINIKKFVRSLVLTGCLAASIVAAICLSGNTAPVMAQAEPSIQQASPVLWAGASAPKSSARGQKTAVVDAGHGGFDIGATSVSGVHESDLNLKVAQFLKADLEEAGVRVIMTRKDENAIDVSKDEDMAKRRQIIKDNGSDIVVSVHMNADTDASFSGPIVLYLPGANQGEKLAKMIQYSLQDKLKPQVKNTARAENLYILQSGSQPSVLVECGFITNVQEEALLVQDEYQQRIAAAITQGCMEYLQP